MTYLVSLLDFFLWYHPVYGALSGNMVIVLIDLEQDGLIIRVETAPSARAEQAELIIVF